MEIWHLGEKTVYLLSPISEVIEVVSTECILQIVQNSFSSSLPIPNRQTQIQAMDKSILEK